MPHLSVVRDPIHEHSPHVGEMAERIAETFGPQSGGKWAKRWALIEKVLSFAAEAEQRIAEQQARIAYLEALSNSDELTGLANRRGFERFMRRTLDLARRHGEHGIFAYVDLDNFKAINDDFGHTAGDRVLQRVASILSRNVRLSDYVARLGGDEFAVVLVHADGDHGELRMRILRDLINNTKLKIGGRQFQLNASFGTVPYGPDSEVRDLLQQADRAMYREKIRRRRNAH